MIRDVISNDGYVISSLLSLLIILIVKKINGNFQTNAITADGSIEIATNLRKKILCLMFHPERKNPSKIKIDKLIKSFLNGSTDISSR